LIDSVFFSIISKIQEKTRENEELRNRILTALSVSRRILNDEQREFCYNETQEVKSMEEMRAKLCRIADLPQSGKPVVSINIKPYVSIIVCILVGILMIAAKFVWIVGAVLIVVALLVLWKTPNYILLEAYPDYFVVYTRGDEELCQMVRWDEVQEWVFRQGKAGMDMLVVRVSEEEFVFINAYSSTKLVHCFNKFVPDKEAHRQQQAKMKNSPFKWPEKWGRKK